MNVLPVSDPNRAGRLVPNVGIVGHSRAGKTVFIASIKRALERRNWNVEIDPDQGRYLTDLINTLEDGRFPAKTPVRPEYERVELISRHSKTSQEFKLTLVDPAGELFETDTQGLSDEHRRQRDAARRGLEANLGSCTGFLILLDLEHKSETFVQTVNHFLLVVDAALSRLGQGSGGARDARKLNRVVVLFSKADLLPWQHRYRARNAADWVADPKNKMEDLVRLVQNNFLEARFEFVSTIGWHLGTPNVRTSLTPRPFDVGNRAAYMRGEHMPDPALDFDTYSQGIEDESQFRFMKAMPIFTDPLRITPYVLPKRSSQRAPIAGVEFFPGRRHGMSHFSPWNVVEPLLWAAEATD